MAHEYSAWQAIPHFCEIGCIMSTLAGGGVFSTSGDTMSTSVDTMSTSVDIMSTSGDIMMHMREQIKVVTSCSTHKIDQQKTDG